MTRSGRRFEADQAVRSTPGSHVGERRLDVRRYRFAVSPEPRDDPTNAPDFPFDVVRELLADRLPEVPQLRYPSNRSAAGLAWSSMTATTGVGANGR
jgi:hypothetical protein